MSLVKLLYGKNDAMVLVDSKVVHSYNLFNVGWDGGNAIQNTLHNVCEGLGVTFVVDQEDADDGLLKNE